MATTSRRALHLLSLLAARPQWSLPELTERLEVSPRTVTRDIDTLRQLGYAITTVRGPGGGYRLGAGTTLPPLLLNDDQALAVAVALQTVVARGSRRSTRSTRQPSSQATRYQRAAHTARWCGSMRLAGAKSGSPGPGRVPSARSVSTTRACLRRTAVPTAEPFPARELPGDVATFVMTSPDRGDTPAAWQCRGSARLALPAAVVARWAPGGSVVEQLEAGHCRLTLGAWSWAGIAGILATFDTELTEVRPPELVHACARIAQQWAHFPS